jgi:uncharacterized protein (DUF1330 family)
MPIDLGPEDLQRLRAADDGRPFVIAQLLKFAPGGRDQYLAYSREAQRILRGSGAAVVYAGECEDALGTPAGHAWDVILLVRYPSRAAYVDMLSNPAFQEIAGQRRKSLRDAVFLAMDDWPGR